MSRISELQSRRNSDSREAWASFAEHRSRVTALLQGLVTTSNDSLCVFGAGNCNDLDLTALLADYASIQLVDLDAEALAAGVRRQAVETERLTQQGGLDVTGVERQLSKWSVEAPASSLEVEACLAALRQTPQLPDGPFSVVASTCLLSQLIDSVVHTLGERHPRFLELLTALRLQHLKLLVECAAPGGVVVLLTDIVSSVTCPQLLGAKDAELPRLVSEAINARNFFTGVNPAVLLRLFSREPALASVARSAEMTRPWLWDLGPRHYAVCAIVVRINQVGAG